MMNQQLTSEINLLSGKLQALEDFRQQRDELNNKFSEQEKAMKEREVQHNQELYDAERKIVVAKNRMKLDMIDRLNQLSTDFQEVTDVRIAASTQRLIKENISLNTEINLMLTTNEKLYNQNRELKHKEGERRQEIQLREQETKMALLQTKDQSEIMEKLDQEYQKVQSNLKRWEEIESSYAKLKTHSEALETQVKELTAKSLILEQNLHCVRCERADLHSQYHFCKTEMERLTQIILSAEKAIKTVLRLEETDEDKAAAAISRQNLLHHLLNLMSVRHEKRTRDSVETIESITTTYIKGDLGFIPTNTNVKMAFRDIRSAITKSKADTDDISRSTDIYEGGTCEVSDVPSVASLEPERITSTTQRSPDATSPSSGDVCFEDSGDCLRHDRGQVSVTGGLTQTKFSEEAD